MTRLRRLLVLPAALLALAALACGGEDEGTTDPALPSEATLQNVVSAVLVPAGCASSSCHSAEDRSGELALTTPAIVHQSLVGVPAAGDECGASGLARVVAGDAEESLLYLKLRHLTPCGDGMPARQLPSDRIEFVRRWIEDGALP